MKLAKLTYKIFLTGLLSVMMHNTVMAQFFQNNGQIIQITPETQMTIQGDVENLGSILNDGELSVSGDWTNLNIYLGDGGKFILNGAGIQIIRHNNQSYYVLVIDGGGAKLFESDVNVIDSLLLSDGIVDIQDGRTLLLQEGAVVIGGSDISYVNGPLFRTGTGDLFFPVGTATTYAPLELIDVTGTAPVVGIEVIEPNPPATSGFGIRDISEERYWQKTVSSGTFEDSKVKLSIVDESIIDNMQKAVVGEADSPGGEFKSLGQISFSGDASSGTVTSDFRTSASVFAVGREENENRVADSLALVAFFQALDGENWDDNTGWLEDGVPLDDWFGITVNGSERINSINLADNGLTGTITNQLKALNECTILNLSNNNITGEVPEQINRMIALQTLNLANNQITSIPDFTTIPGLIVLDVSGNALQFTSLEPNIPIGSGFNYAPQDSLGSPQTTLKLDVGQSFSLSVTTDSPNDEFIWLRNGEDLSGETTSVFEEDSINRNNMGTFYCEVTNPNVPGLTLYSHSRTVLAKADISGTALVGTSDVLRTGSILLLEVNDGSYDTINSKPLNQSGTYIFADIILGDYVILASPVSASDNLPTYHYNEIQWDQADIIPLNQDTTGVDIQVVGPPPELTSADGNGLFDGFVESTLEGDEGGRLETGRRVRRAGVMLRRRPPTSRSDDDGFVLIAYVQTDDNGEFTIDNLPPGTYRIFIEYPGVPMDTTSFVQFELGMDMDQNEFSISATVTEDGIVVDLLNETGVPFDYIDHLAIYPNPASDRIFVEIDARSYYNIDLEIFDMRGVSMFRENIDGYRMGSGKLEIDVSGFDQGMYLMKITVPEFDNQLYRVGKLNITRR